MTYDGIARTRVFTLASYQTVAGDTIRNIRLGYQSFGRLNDARDNAILIPPPNTGSCNFAGRYPDGNGEVGYWHSIVGPGEALDTNSYFLVSLTTLCSYELGDGRTITTGPASIDPDTGKPYGMRFPRVQIRDFVNLQKIFLESLGIERLHAVMGGSMGGQQTFEWAAVHPEMVGRIIAVVPIAWMDPYTMLKFRMWRKAVSRDRNWCMGDYYDKEAPTGGLTHAFREFYIDTFAPEFFEGRFGRGWADPTKNPTEDMTNLYAAYEWFDRKAVERAKATDANSFIYMQRALELFSVAGRHTLEECVSLIKCPVLLIASKNDQLFTTAHARRTRGLLRRQGNWVDYFELEGPLGHFNGFMGIKPAEGIITEFLASDHAARPDLKPDWGAGRRRTRGYRREVRDRFTIEGPDSMSDADLLEVLLSFALPQDDITPVTSALTNRFFDLSEMFRAEMATLRHVSFHKEGVALLLKLVEALAHRLASEGGLDTAPAGSEAPAPMLKAAQGR